MRFLIRVNILKEIVFVKHVVATKKVLAISNVVSQNVLIVIVTIFAVNLVSQEYIILFSRNKFEDELSRIIIDFNIISFILVKFNNINN